MTPETLTATETRTFVARQPIVDRDKRVWGYELLFRPDSGPVAGVVDPGRATARVIVDALFAIGLDTLVGDRLAFVNVGREMLLEGLPSVLPHDRVVIELSADVEADDDVLAACRNLRSAGYALAIDDFVLTESTEALIPLASYLKVDFQFATTPAWRERIGAVRRPGGALLTAKRVETPDAFHAGVNEGFSYFQGFFLGHPVTMPGRSIAGADLTRLQLLQALQNPLLSVAQIEELVKPDAALCYQILQTVNSAAFAQHRHVQSIRQALLLIGRDAVRRWTSVWTLAGLGSNAHPELITMSAVRARCCEVLGETLGGETLAAEGFLVGLCSLLDTILGIPMETVVQKVPLSDQSRAALLGGSNRLRSLLDCTVAYERGDWALCAERAAEAKLDAGEIPAAYLDAMQWMRELQRL